MRIHHFVIDEFFEEPLELRNWALERGFKDEVSPIDDALYRGVCKDPPWIFRNEAEVKLSHLLHTPTKITLSFLRLTLENTWDPTRRAVHLDPLYAKCLCTVYLSLDAPPGYGTCILRHREMGLEGAPETQMQVDLWDRDANDLKAWDMTGLCEGAWNRALVMPANKFHMSMPQGGFGKTPPEGRMVFVAFFDV